MRAYSNFILARPLAIGGGVCEVSPLMSFFLPPRRRGRVSARNVWLYWGGPLKIGKHNSLSPKKNYIGSADIVFQFLPPSFPPRVLYRLVDTVVVVTVVYNTVLCGIIIS